MAPEVSGHDRVGEVKAQNDLPAPILPVGGDDAGVSAFKQGSLNDITDRTGTTAPSTDAGVIAPAEIQRERLSQRMATRLALMMLFGLEVVALGSVAFLGAINIAHDPSVPLAGVVGLNPGEQVVGRFDVVRGVAFYLTLALAAVVLVIAMKGLFSTARQGGHGTRLGQACLMIATLGNLGAAGVAMAVNIQTRNWYNTYGKATPPSRISTSQTLVIVFFAIFAWGAVVLRRAPWRVLWRRLILGLVVSALLFASAIAVQQASTGSYYSLSFDTGSIPPLAVPLANGFWTASDVQHPASSPPQFVSCGSAMDCALFGSGYGHVPGVGSGEVTVTTDGGVTWKSWLLNAPLNVVDPFLLYPVCRGDQCIGPVLVNKAGVAHLQLSSGDAVEATVTYDSVLSKTELWQLTSCPTQTWCAGVSEGSYGPVGTSHPAGLLTSKDGGNTWAEHSFPTSIVPSGAELVEQLTACPSVDHCLVAGTVGVPPGKTVSPLASDSKGRTFIAITTDDGIRWTTSFATKALLGISQINCPDATHCMATGDLPATTDANTPAYILSTSDGGATWSRLRTNISDGGTFDRLTCGDATHCLLSNQGQIFRTSDGGITWQQLPGLPAARGQVIASLAGITCPSASFCIAAGAETARAGQPSFGVPLIFVTHDGGTSWSVTDVPVPRSVP